MNRSGVKFSPSSAKRVAEATRFVEQQPRSQVPELGLAVDFGGTRMFHVTTALNPMSGATPGASGRGRIQKFNGTSYSDFSTTTYTIINDTEKTVAIGAYVLCAPGPGGKYHMITVDKCSNLS